MNRGAYSRGYISQGASDGHLSLLEHLGPVHDRPSVGCHRDHAAGPECNEIALVHTGGETACSRHSGEHERLRVPVLRGRSAKSSRVGEARRWGAGKECRFWAHYRSTRSLSHCWTVRRGRDLSFQKQANRVDLGWPSDIRRRLLFEEAARYVVRYAAASNNYKLEHGIMIYAPRIWEKKLVYLAAGRLASLHPFCLFRSRSSACSKSTNSTCPHHSPLTPPAPLSSPPRPDMLFIRL